MSPDQVIEYAGSIHLAGQQTYDLLENLLEWSRVQMNKIVFEPQNLEVDDVITNAMSDLTSVIKDKQVKVSVRSDALQLIGDLGMTTIIVRNLLGNAIKFTNRRGAIVVTSERVDEFIHIHVKDNGIGMNSEALTDLFNQERSQSTRGTDGEKGTGLGLLISKGFAEMQNGDILVDSQVGTGTTITLALPAALEA